MHSHAKSYQELIAETTRNTVPGGEAQAGQKDERKDPCAGRAQTQSLPGFHVYRFGHPTRTFQFAHVGYQECAEDGTWFIIEFNEPEKWRLTVCGRNLIEYYEHLTQQRLPWIREAERDFAGDGVPIILAPIEIEPVEVREDTSTS